MSLVTAALPPEIQLLATLARFIDLHDSRRDHGNAAEFTAEKRAGHGDGLYLGIAMAIVKRLHDQDQTSSQDYLHFGAIFTAVLAECPDAPEAEVRYALNVLRRPTEFRYRDREIEGQPKTVRSEKRASAIIEKTDYADEYRLSATGRNFVMLSNATKDSLYIRGDAYNLLDAIENNDFKSVEVFSDELIQTLREAILDVRSGLEKSGRHEKINKYIDNFTRYRNVIENTLAIIGQAEHKVESPATLEEFIKWSDDAESDLTYHALLSQIARVRQVLEIFNRVVQELVSASLTDNRTATPPPSFLSLALQQVRKPVATDIRDFLISQWSATALHTPFYSPLDGIDAVRIVRRVGLPAAMAFDDSGYELVSHVGNLEFIAHHGTDIANALREAPLRLSEAITKGWCWVNEGSALGDLVGTFSAPDTLPIDGDIQICLTDQLQQSDVIDGMLFYTDLIILIARETNEQQ